MFSSLYSRQTESKFDFEGPRATMITRTRQRSSCSTDDDDIDGLKPLAKQARSPRKDQTALRRGSSIEAPIELQSPAADTSMTPVAPSPARMNAAFALKDLLMNGNSLASTKPKQNPTPYMEPAVHSTAPASSSVPPPSSSSRASSRTAHNLRTAPTAASETKQSGSKEYKRSEKSLGLLATNFIKVFGKFPTETSILSLDKAAALLGVERRRIYDIVNILESLDFVKRQKKNTYIWLGGARLRSTLNRLLKEAIDVWPEDAARHGLRSATTSASSSSTSSASEIPCSTSSAASTRRALSSRSGSAGKTVKCASVSGTKKNGVTEGQARGDRKGKSLGFLCVRFVQIFLVGHEVVSLAFARDMILGDENSPGVGRSSPSASDGESGAATATEPKDNKTKVRRLYDIANVLISLGIIEKDIGASKVKVGAGERKPCFRWVSDSPRDLLEAPTSKGLRGFSTGNEPIPKQNSEDHTDAAAASNLAANVRAKIPLTRSNTSSSFASSIATSDGGRSPDGAFAYDMDNDQTDDADLYTDQGRREHRESEDDGDSVDLNMMRTIAKEAGFEISSSLPHDSSGADASVSDSCPSTGSHADSPTNMETTGKDKSALAVSSSSSISSSSTMTTSQQQVEDIAGQSTKHVPMPPPGSSAAMALNSMSTSFDITRPFNGAIVAAAGGESGGNNMSAWFDPKQVVEQIPELKTSTAAGDTTAVALASIFPLSPDDMLHYQVERLRQFMADYQDRYMQWVTHEEQIARQKQWDLEDAAKDSGREVFTFSSSSCGMDIESKISLEGGNAMKEDSNNPSSSSSSCSTSASSTMTRRSNGQDQVDDVAGGSSRNNCRPAMMSPTMMAPNEPPDSTEALRRACAYVDRRANEHDQLVVQQHDAQRTWRLQQDLQTEFN